MHPAIKKVARSKRSQAVAGLLYAIYNGGPSQRNKYIERMRKGRFYESDRLFEEKFKWVRNGQWDQYRLCVRGS